MQKPCPLGVAHQSSPPRPPMSLASTAAHSQAAGSLATLACTRLPHGAPQHTHFLPAVCMGRARSHLLSPAPSHRREPLTHRAPCLPASGQTLNWEEVILNIWGAHLRVGSGPHGAWRKWQHMQLCHFLSGGCSGGGSTEQQQAFLGHSPGLGWGRPGASVDSEPGTRAEDAGTPGRAELQPREEKGDKGNEGKRERRKGAGEGESERGEGGGKQGAGEGKRGKDRGRGLFAQLRGLGSQDMALPGSQPTRRAAP